LERRRVDKNTKKMERPNDKQTKGHVSKAREKSVK